MSTISVSAETIVNTTTANGQDGPSITALNDGGYVVTWASYNQDGSGWGIYSQRYNSDGTQFGSETLVNSTTYSDQSLSSVAALQDGGYVIGWTSSGQDGSEWGIYAQRYDASGASVGSEFQVNSFTSYSQTEPMITALSDGGFLVNWISAYQDGSGWGIYGQRYAASGAATGGEFRVNTTTTEYQQDPSITALSDGGFVVSWMSYGQEGANWGIYMQRYDASGAVIGGEVRVNATTADEQYYPSIAALSGGGFVVTWMSNSQDGSGWGVYAQRYNSDGSLFGGETLINTTTAFDQEYPSITALHGGGYAIGWYGNGPAGIGMYMQIFAADGTPDGGEILVGSNVGNITNLNGLALATLADGSVAATWTGFDDSGTGVVHATVTIGAFIEGTSGDDTLYGTPGDDVITAFGGNDQLYGGDGNDTLDGGAGNDTLDGGGGSDTASYASATGSVFAQVGYGADEYDPGFNTYLSHDTFVSIENITGSDYDDELYGDDNANVLDGRGGNDFIQGRGGDDTIYGGDGNDTLQGDRGDLFTGPSGNDIVYGEGGNDVLRGGLGDDQLYGGDGNDLMRGGGGVDSFDGGADDGEGFNGIGDRVSFYEQRATQGAVADLRTGVISNDGYGNVETMTGIESLGAGTAFVDTFYGNDGRNFLFGDIGDHVYGFGGDDLFQLSSAPATLDGGSDTDTVLLNTGGGALTPDTNADGVAEVMGAATEGWFVNLLGGTMVDGYGNFGTVTGIENVTGSDLADTIRGDHNNNVLLGGGGDDFVVGNGGDDMIDGGDGSDLLRGDAQNYTGGPFGNDILIGGAGDDHMRGGPGVDSFDGGTDSGGESIYGGIGDRISFYEMAATAGVVADLRTGIISNDGFGNVETMTGIESLGGDTAYVDTFYGNDERNTLLGGRGDNLYGFGGDDQMSLSVAAAVVDGGDGIDVLQVNSAGGWLMPDANSDGLAETAAAAAAGWSIDLAAGTMVDGYGNAGTITGVENVDGSELGDTLIGDDNSNVLNGGDGDDVLEGRGGSDTLDGGNGSDTVSYANAAGAVDLDLGAGLADEYDSDGITYLSTDTLANIENATGSAFSDALVGSSGNNVLQGLAGNDFLDGRAGDDQIDGGAGFDTANYASAGSAVTVDLAVGTASGGGGNDTLTGIEAVNGSNFDDTLIGDSGANSLTGRNGNDFIYGGNGDDFIRGGAGDDLMDGGSGFDRVSHYGTNITNGVTVDLRIAGPQNTGHGWDTYTGIESLSGSRYSDTLIGDDNDNWLIAADGNDTLVGNGGNDLLTVGDGELGPASGNHSIDGGSGSDTVDVSWSTLGGDGVTLSLALQGAAQDSGHGLLTLTNIENLSGSAHDDVLTGDGNANTLSGHGGNDLLAGGAGNDSLYGDGAMIADTSVSSGGSGPITFFADVTAFDPSLIDGNDTLEGGLGDDNLYGGGGNDTATYANASGAVQAFLYNVTFGEAFGADGYDQLHDIENLTGSAFNDQLGGNNQANVLTGGDGHDALRGNAGNDTLLGGNGDDFLNGGVGDDILDGGAGFDRVAYYTAATSGVTVNLNIVGPQATGQGNDTLIGIENVSGTAFNDTLTGDNNSNVLWGSPATLTDGSISAANNDTLDGGGGDDLLIVGIGNHSLTGGGGNDTVGFTENGNPEPGLTISLALQGVAQTTGAGSWTLNGIENLSGGIANDSLTGDSNANVLAGNSGDDTLVGGAGNDTLYGDGQINWDTHGTGGSGPIATFPDVASLGGADGNDILDGGDGDDILAGGGGNDTLIGGAGYDTIDGGAGTDTVSYWSSAGAVAVDLQFGFADEYTSDGLTWLSSDTLSSIEHAIGSQFDDVLLGSTGDNYLDGADGGDIIRGRGGNDQIFGGAGNDDISGDFGTTVQTGGGDDILDGGDGNDGVRGRDGNDIVLGGAGNDFVEGGTGDDLIDGGSGYDRAAFYSMATTGVHVDLNLQGVAQDTNQGMDTLINIENVSGSPFGDTLIGDDNDNQLWGSGATLADGTVSAANNDTLIGNGGNDLLVVGIGNHSLTGGSGTDTVAFTENGIPEAGLTISLALQGFAQATGNGSWALDGIENLSGGTSGDNLTGDGNANVLAGDLGDDNLAGGAGNDTLYGDGRIGIAYDVGSGSSGPIATFADVTSLDPSLIDGNDTLEGGLGDDTLNGGGGIDTATYANASGGVNVNLGAGFANGADGNDTLIGIENATGSEFDDVLVGSNGDNVLDGRGGNDTIIGQQGNDTLDGGDGDDIVQGNQGADTLFGGDGADNLSGNQGDDTIYGGDGNDAVVGNPGNDTLYGGNGNDFLRGDNADGLTPANDYIDGGAGFDRVTYYNLNNAVTVNLMLQGAAQNTGQGMDTLLNIEAVSGSVFSDTLIGDDADNWFFIGGAGADHHTVTSDTISGNGGNDLIIAGLGNHILDGGTGTDTLGFTWARTELFGGVTVSLELQGAAQNTGQGSMTLSGFENLSGSMFDDVFTGNSGNNVLAGGAANDVLYGGAGNDVLLGDGELAGDNTSFAGVGPTVTVNELDYAGVDFYDSSGTIVYLFEGQDLYDVGGNALARADLLDGDGTPYSQFTLNGVIYDLYFGDPTASDGVTGNDILDGGDGDDTLFGGAGNDTLIGGAGYDTIDGGAGTDSVSYWSSAGAVSVDLEFGFADEYTSDGLTWLSSDTLSSIEYAIGSQFNDVLLGSNGDNYLDGAGGDDIIRGRSGNDQIFGGAGNDDISGDFGTAVQTGGGNDIVDGGDGNDIVRGRDGNDTVVGGAGNDFVEGGTGDDIIDGGTGYDRAAFYSMATTGVHVDLNLQGVAQNTNQGMDTLINIENVSGSQFGDTLIGDGNDNSLSGSAGTLADGTVSAANNDTLDGGGGNDLLLVGIGNHSLTGGSGTDTVAFIENGVPETPLTISLALQGVAQATGNGSWTLNGIENLSGGTAGDTLTGDGGDNVLAGDTGNDTLVGGAGNDTLYGDGRIGIDYGSGPGSSGPIATFADVTAIDPTLVDGNDTLVGGLGNDTLSGGGGTDSASYANASGSVTVNLGTGTATGADGNDTLVSIENVTGSAFADTITGDANANLLNGGGGNDTLDGRLGNDTLIGGAGIDTASYANASGAVVVNLTLGNSSGADGSDTLTTIENVTGSAFADTITGDANANILNGGAGDDTLNGRLGNDTLNGGTGIDTASYANASAAVTVNLNTGSASGADGTDTLIAIENAIGSAFADTITGDANANSIYGGDGNDTLNGGKGDDLLYGGRGNDTMTGQQGNDRFVIEATSGQDTVTDFLIGNDKVVFDPTSGITSFSQLTITKVGGDARVSWAGGNSILLQGVKASSLTAADFQFGSAAFAAAAVTSMSTNGALIGAIAGAGLADISSSGLAFSTTHLDSLGVTGGAVHNQAFAPEAFGMATPSMSGLSIAPVTQLADIAHESLTGFGASGLDSSGFVFEASSLGTGGHQPSDLLQATAPTTQMPVAGSLGMTAIGVAIPSAGQLASLGMPENGPVQSNAVVGEVLADALGGGSDHGPSIDVLLASLPGHGMDEGSNALAVLANHSASPGMTFGLMADFGTAHFSLETLHVDAPPPA